MDPEERCARNAIKAIPQVKSSSLMSLNFPRNWDFFFFTSSSIVPSHHSCKAVFSILTMHPAWVQSWDFSGIYQLQHTLLLTYIWDNNFKKLSNLCSLSFHKEIINNYVSMLIFYYYLNHFYNGYLLWLTHDRDGIAFYSGMHFFIASQFAPRRTSTL